MKTPFLPKLGLSLCLVLGVVPGLAMARGSDAGGAVKAAEARLRASQAPTVPGKNRSAAERRTAVSAQPAAGTENFFTKFAARMTRAVAPVQAEVGREMPVVTVRESRPVASKAPSAPESRRFESELSKLVSGIVSRLGPMQMEFSDDEVLNPSADSLALMNHPNIRPVIPIAPVPVPGRLVGQAPTANPLTEQRTSWLATKVAEKLGLMRGEGAAVVAVEPPKAVEQEEPDEVTREIIELMSILSVPSQKTAPEAAKVVARTPTESRISALSLLAAVAEGDSSVGTPAPANRPAALREVPRFPGAKLETIPVINPAREIDAASRSRVLVLLKPDSLAASQ